MNICFPEGSPLEGLADTMCAGERNSIPRDLRARAERRKLLEAREVILFPLWLTDRWLGDGTSYHCSLVPPQEFGSFRHSF